MLYAITLGVPTAAVSIKALASNAGNGKVANVELLGSTETIKWSQKKNALTIQASKKYPSQNAVVYKIQFEK